jgi:hypothetical protein
MAGGVGTCGGPLCCATFLQTFAPISIKMAKTQGLMLNPQKVSGQCGRLMCCLAYEQDSYMEMRKGLPKTGGWVRTPDGVGKVRDVDVMKRLVKVQFPGSAIREYPGDGLAQAREDEIAEARRQAQETAKLPQPSRPRPQRPSMSSTPGLPVPEIPEIPEFDASAVSGQADEDFEPDERAGAEDDLGPAGAEDVGARRPSGPGGSGQAAGPGPGGDRHRRRRRRPRRRRGGGPQDQPR